MSYELSSDQPQFPAHSTAAAAIFGADHTGAPRRRQWRRVARRKDDAGATLVVALRPADVMDGLAKPIRGARRASGATTRVAPTAEPFVRDATLYQRPI